jgi:hypothetical protein
VDGTNRVILSAGKVSLSRRVTEEKEFAGSCGSDRSRSPSSSGSRSGSSRSGSLASTNYDQDVRDQQLIEAAATVMAAGPSASVADVSRELQSAPHCLPSPVARAVAVAARFAACDIASQKLELMDSKQKTTRYCSSKASMARWACEPTYTTIGHHPPIPKCHQEASDTYVDERQRKDSLCAVEQVDTQAESNVNMTQQVFGVNDGPGESRRADADPEDVEVLSAVGEIPPDLNMSIDSTILEEGERILKEMVVSNDAESQDYGESESTRKRKSTAKQERKQKREKYREEDRAKMESMQKVLESLAKRVADLPQVGEHAQGSQMNDGSRGSSQVNDVSGESRVRRSEYGGGMADRVRKEKPDDLVLDDTRKVLGDQTSNRREVEQVNMSYGSGSRRMQPDMQGKLERIARQVPGLTVHSSGQKSAWKVKLAPNTRVILVGDSNLREVKSVPQDWEVHAFPGARFGHLIEAFSELENSRPRHLECIYIQAGINHRDDRLVPMKVMENLVSHLRRYCARVGFVGVAYSSRLPGPARLRIDALNDAAKDVFGLFVKPMHSREVGVKPEDRDSIHYDSDTVGRIVQSVVSYHLRA